MLRPLVALTFVCAALLAGCGGPEIAYTEVESAPAELPIPAGTSADALPATETDSNTTTRPRETPTAEPVVPSTGGATIPEDTTTTTEPVAPVEPVTEPVDPVETDDSGGATPPTEEPVTPTEPTDDTGGATAGGASDQFCADNPGAC